MSIYKISLFLNFLCWIHLMSFHSLFSLLSLQVISACVVTLPIDISVQISEESSLDPPSIGPSLTPYHANVVRGDLQEEVWFYSEEKDSTNEQVSSCLSIVSFRGRGNFVVECFELSYGPITSMCNVSQQVWLGSEDGRIILYDALNHSMVFSRILAIKSGQGILYISHLTKLRQVHVNTYTYTHSHTLKPVQSVTVCLYEVFVMFCTLNTVVCTFLCMW